MAKTRNLLAISDTESLGVPAASTNPLAGFGGAALPESMGVEDVKFGE